MAGEFLMKGKVWSERKHKMTYPCAAEVKYDEIRCHAKREGDTVEFLSYTGNVLANMHHWVDSFLQVMKAYGFKNLDLGVLVNGNFNDSYRWVRSTNGLPPEKLDKKTGKVAPALFPHMVEFYLFDLPDLGIPYHDRSMFRRRVAQSLAASEVPTSVPFSVMCDDENGVDAAFVSFREKGFEGAMVKALDHYYTRGKRIDGWLKMKPEEEADGKILSFNEAISEDGLPLGRAGSINVECEDGSTAAPYGIDHALATLMWDNPADYVGGWLTFNYMERDRKGGYRHPTFGRLRENK